MNAVLSAEAFACLQYQVASRMYHCLHCDAFTSLEDLNHQ